MIIIDPVALGDVAITRASPKWAIDRNGRLVQVPANTLAVTYDMADLSKAPWALIEAAATNHVYFSEDFNAAQWGPYFTKPTVTKGYLAPDGSSNASRLASSDYPGNSVSGLLTLAGTTFAGVIAVSIWARCVAGTLQINLGLTDGQAGLYTLTEKWQRLVYVTPGPVNVAAGDRIFQILEGTPNNVEWEVWGAQVEVVGTSGTASSYIPTAGAPATRAADVIGPGAGLVYSNVPIAESTYNATTQYAKDAVVLDPATHNVFQSLIANNVGRGLTDTTAWTPRGATNRWAMLDQYNNTQTTAQDEILIVVSPKAITRGFYIGNVDATEVRISVTDVYKGVIYQETQSLRLSTSGSSFYNWCFNRIRRRSWAVSLALPPYYGALVTISIRKPGGTVACGMCAVGPTMDLGKTLMGLGAEIKDFSEISFNFDGTSTLRRRNWAKRISADISVDSDQVEAVYEELARLRQKPIVWVGSPKFGLSIAFGRYSGIKPVIKGATRWEMSAQIEGTV